MKLLTRMKVAAIAAICALASSLSAADYSLTIKNGVLTGYTGTLPEELDLVIPDGIKTIGAEAFKYCYQLTSVVIPDSVKEIRREAFRGCVMLASVTLPDGLKVLPAEIFKECYAASITIPASVSKIELNALNGVWKIDVDSGNKNFKMKNGLLLSKDGTILVQCPSFETGDVVVPSGVKTIQSGAFESMADRASVTLPASVTKIEGTFGDYYSVGEIRVDSANRNYCVRDSGLLTKDGKEFIVAAEKIKGAYSVPAGVTKIWSEAFYGQDEMTSLTIPASVTQIDDYAFRECNALKVVTVKGLRVKQESKKGWFGRDPDSTSKELRVPVGYKGDIPNLPDGSRVVYMETDGSEVGGSEESLFRTAQTFNGWLTGDDVFAGTIQVKTTKATANRKTGVVTSKATATVSVVGGKKQTFSGNLEIDEDGTYGYLEVEKNGRYLYVEMSSDGLYGEYSDDEYGYEIQGVRDLFASTDADDKASVSEVLANWKKTVRCAWQSKSDDESSFNGYNTMTFTVGAKGKTKVAGTLVDGTKFSVASQMIIGGDGSCYVPVIVSKKGVSLSFNLILSEDGFSNCRGEGIEADGLDAEYIRFGTSTEIVDDTLTVEVDTGAYLWDLLGGEEGYVYSDLLPDGLEIAVKGTKLTVPKAGKVVMDRYGDIDYDKAGDNPSGLKLSYKAKDGTFTGSFKAYVDYNGRLKTVTVSVSGLIIEGIGYGTATVKKIGSVPFHYHPIGV